MDSNLEYQQDLSNAGIGVIVLRAINNKIETLTPLMEDVREKLKSIATGEIVKFSDLPHK